MGNHLAAETSPYLLQHAGNPVDWYPWGEEALQLAREQDKPILLSIGYAACHWCHVMAHESFEDEATAALMNRSFINIKVDREERPDLDSIYMAAVTSMTGHGGWPMTVFLTPTGAPFFSGTYFPPQPRYGMASFPQILNHIAQAWQERREEILASADGVVQHLKDALPTGASQPLDQELLTAARAELAKRFDMRWGGFGAAPKFPQPMVLEFLLREALRQSGDDSGSHALGMVTTTLRRMAQGGIYDHLGGGFARYSTDAHWLVPHFEKMLYDNAQLARIYLHAFQVTGDALFRQVAEETLDYVLREMRHADGGFYSSQDADSEGVEGQFFVWSAREVAETLGEDATLFMWAYGVSESGNWQGKNILHLAHTTAEAADKFGLGEPWVKIALRNARQALLACRSRRVRPGLDDKVLTAWNGMMMGALAEAGRVLGRADYLAAATGNAQFLYRTMRLANGRLLRTWRAGSVAHYNAYLEDHACLAEGLLSLYEATFDSRWYQWALELARIMRAHFAAGPGNPGGAGFFDTSDDHETLIQRPRDVQDNAMPSGNARAAMVLFRLGLYSGNGEFLKEAGDAVGSLAGLMARHGQGFGEWLGVASFMLGNPRELALLGSPESLGELRGVVNERYRPNLVVACGLPGEAGQPALLAGRGQRAGRPTAFLCERFTCQAPVTDAAELRALLDAS